MKKKSLCSQRWIFIPFTWHLTKMFHSNGAAAIPQQGMGLVITQTSTILLSTPQNWEEKAGQWANSVLKLSFSNRKKSLKCFFLQIISMFSHAVLLAGLTPSPAAQRCSRTPWGEQDPASCPLCLPKTALQPARKSSEDGNGGISSW